MEELNKLSEFLNSLPDKAIDFYPVSNSFSRPYLENINKTEIEIFGRTQADCLIGLWKKNDTNTFDAEAAPIVWIDSEGSPNAAIACGVIEFISLLYFDTGFIYDTLATIIKKKEFKAKSKYEIEELEENIKRNYFYYDQLQQFILTKLHIQKPENPGLLIYEAYMKNETFGEWFNNKIGK